MTRLGRAQTDFGPWARATQQYADWLSSLPTRKLATQWSNRICSSNADEAEGAVAEAIVWDYLRNRDIGVELAERVNNGGPDFRCRARAAEFYVEVANIATSAVTRATGLEDLPTPGARSYGLLTSAIYERTEGKADQLKSLDGPLVVCITTLHFSGSALCIERDRVAYLLTGTPFLCGSFDDASGTLGEFHNTVNFDHSLFISTLLTDAGLPTARRTYLSAVVAGGFGLKPPHANVYGILHPEPMHPFDTTVLPDVPFGSLSQWPLTSDRIDVVWSDRAQGSRDKIEPERRVLAPAQMDYGDINIEKLRQE